MQELAYSYPPDANPRGILGDLGNALGILCRGWRFSAVAVSACLLLAVAYLSVTKREYQATARLLFLRHGARPLNVASNTDSGRFVAEEEYLPTYSSIIASPKVLKHAIAKVGLKNLPTLSAAKGAGEDPVDLAAARLKITRPDRQAAIVRLDYQAGSPGEAARTLEAILTSYQEFLEETSQEANRDVVKLIAAAGGDMGKKVKQMEAEYQDYRRTHPILANGDGQSFVASRVEQWDKKANETMVKTIQLKAILELGRKLEREGADLWTVVHAMNQLGGDSSTLIAAMNTGKIQAGSSDFVRQLAQERQQLVDRFGPKYAKVQELQKRITQVNDTQGRSDRTELRGLLSSIEESLASLEAMRSEIGDRFAKDQQQAKEAEADLLTEKKLRGDLERQRKLYDTVMDQLKQAEYSGDFSVISAQTIEPAKALAARVWPKTSQVLALALAVGCVSGAGASLVTDLMNRRIRSVDELRRVMDVHVLGQIPQTRGDEADAAGEFGLVGHALPRSSWAEAYREARTNLEYHRRSRQAKAILVTSPNVGDGKSVSASNLAVSLAHAGRKVLLVDGDLRKPSQHRIHGLNKELGLTHILKDLLPFHRVVQRTAVGNLDLVANGPEVPNPADLLMSSRFADFLVTARQHYDIIIIDSAPILRVTDTLLMGAAADAVVLVVRDASLSPQDAARTLELLKTQGICVLGTVINRINPSREGYGYSYSYGRTPGPYGRGDAFGAIEHDHGLEPATGGGFRPTPPANGRPAPPHGPFDAHR